MSTDSKIIAPVINLNGTEGMTLWAQWGDLDRNISALQDALYRAMPHGRDYPQGRDSYVEAREQHQRLFDCLREIDNVVHRVRMELHVQLVERDPEIPF